MTNIEYEKKVDEQECLYLEYTDFGNTSNRGGLKHMKVENKAVRQYENPEDEEHCIANIFEKYLSLVPSRQKQFYFRPLVDDGSGIPKFGKQPVGRNKLSQMIPVMCKAASIEGHKTGHSGKVMCGTVLHQRNFSDHPTMLKCPWVVTIDGLVCIHIYTHDLRLNRLTQVLGLKGKTGVTNRTKQEEWYVIFLPVHYE